jgi:hypothetical protein
MQLRFRRTRGAKHQKKTQKKKEKRKKQCKRIFLWWCKVEPCARGVQRPIEERLLLLESTAPWPTRIRAAPPRRKETEDEPKQQQLRFPILAQLATAGGTAAALLFPVHVPAAGLANPEDWHAGTNAAVAIASLLLHLSFPLFVFSPSRSLLSYLCFSFFRSLLSAVFSFLAGKWKVRVACIVEVLAGKWKVEVACVVEVADEVKNTN